MSDVAMAAAPAAEPKRKPAKSKPRRRPAPNHRFRGIPPVPTDIDIDTLPGSYLLTVPETAGLIRATIGAVDTWRSRYADGSHPLKWQRVGNSIRYRADAVRAYIQGKA